MTPVMIFRVVFGVASLLCLVGMIYSLGVSHGLRHDKRRFEDDGESPG